MILKFVFVYLAYFTLTMQAAEWMGIYRHEKYPGKCAITTRLILDEGQSIKDPTHECRQIVCGFNGSAVFQGCGIISGLPPSCYFGDYADVELPYPHCCERIVICTEKYSIRKRQKQAT